MSDLSIDRLVVLIVKEPQSGRLMKALRAERFQFTVINSTGGVVQEAELCLLIGFANERIKAFLEIVRQNCHTFQKYIYTQGILPGEAANLPLMEAQAGGARIYTMNVVRFEQI